MAKGDPAQTQQVNKVELPAWVNDASKSNYDLASNIASRPLEQYAGPTVAGPSDMTTKGWDMIKGVLGQNSGLYDKASGLLDKASGFQDRASPLYDRASGILDSASPLYGKAEGAFDKAGGTIDAAKDIYKDTAGNLDIAKFLSPYTAEVESRAVTNANTSLEQQLRSVANKATTSGAFGGSRGAVEEGVTRGEGIRNIGDLTATLRKAGLDFATNTAVADRSGRQASAAGLLSAAGGEAGQGSGYLSTAGGLGNQAGGLLSTAAGMLSAGGAAGSTAQGALNTAGARTAGNQTDITNLLTAGQQDTSSRQAQIDALMKQFYEKRDYPLEGLNTRLAALGMSPYGKTETTNKTSTAEDKGPDWATIGLGALKTLPALVAMSDRDTKTDIEKLTEGPIPLYAYRYKSDPKTYPKVVGPMAQDVKKKFPSAVKKVGGKLTINVDNLMEALA